MRNAFLLFGILERNIGIELSPKLKSRSVSERDICLMMQAFVRFVLLCGIGSVAFAQAPAPQKQPTFTEVNGALNPELIHFSEAMRSMFVMLCDGPVPQPMQSRDYYMRESHLTKDQQDEVTIAAVKYRLAMNAAIKKWKSFPKSPASAYIANRDEAWRLFDLEYEKIRESLESDLGPEAYNKLVTFVETYVKKHMTVSAPVVK